MRSCGVMGGGIGGLATSFYLSTLGKGVVDKIYLLESANELGGWVRSHVDGTGLLFEKGPRSIRVAGKVGSNTLELAEELRLTDEILPISNKHPAATNRYIYSNKQLHPLPNTLRSIITTSPPLSRPIMWYAFKELFKPTMTSSPPPSPPPSSPPPSPPQSSSSSPPSSAQSSSSSPPSSASSPLIEDDYSIDSFFRERFGSEVADLMVDPLCRGIFAGRSGSLSMRACFRPIYRLEKDFGSVVKGMLMGPKEDVSSESALVRAAREKGWVVWSLKQGLQQLPHAIEKRLRASEEVDVMLKRSCDRLKLQEGAVQIESGPRDVLQCDHVFSALPSFELSRLTRQAHPQLATLLERLQWVDVAVVNLVYPSHVTPPHVGFGHLVPSKEDAALLGVIYEACSFPLHNGRLNKCRFTVMLGGGWFEEGIGRVDGSGVRGRLEERAVAAVREHLGVLVAPEQVHVNVLQKCIPQYEVGHHKLLTEMRSYVSKNNLPLSLVGSSYDGVSVNDVIYNAKMAVQEFLRRGHS